jgi:MFS family permease
MADALEAKPTRRSIAWSLDAVNFLLSDVRGAFGPFVNVFLVSQLHWTQSRVGLITMIGGLLGLALQTPIGAAIDHTTAKRGVIVLALAVLAVSGFVIFGVPSFWPVMIANGFMSVVGDVFVPAVAALTLGLYAPRFLPRRMGRNGAFDHAGNVFIAMVAAAIGYLFSQRAVFLLAPAFSVLATVAVMTIPASAIDFDRARGFDGEKKVDGKHRAARRRDLFHTPALVALGVSALLFHFANAPLLPFVGQKLAAAHPKEATAMMSSCIIAAQLVMLGVSLLVGRKADSWGRKPILLAGYIALPIRAVLFTFSDNSFWLVGVQILDGIGAGIFAVLVPLIVADVMRGTGRYNLALGAVATMQGIGASVSSLAAGEIVDHAGYTAAFLSLGAVAVAAALVLVFALPETGPTSGLRRPSPGRESRRDSSRRSCWWGSGWWRRVPWWSHR